MKNAYEKIAYDVIRRCLRNVTENHSDEYKSGYAQGVVDLQTEIYKELEQAKMKQDFGFNEASVDINSGS